MIQIYVFISIVLAGISALSLALGKETTAVYFMLSAFYFAYIHFSER
jgi:hypothetical protein